MTLPDPVIVRTSPRSTLLRPETIVGVLLFVVGFLLGRVTAPPVVAIPSELVRPAALTPGATAPVPSPVSKGDADA